MALSAKPTAYAVNTGHSKCPTHLWMFDEASGTTAADKGSGTPLDMTLQSSAMWGTDGTYGSIITCASATSRYALSATGTIWNPSNNVLLVFIAKSTSNGTAAAVEQIGGYGKSDATTPGYGGIRIAASGSTLVGVADDNAVTRQNTGSFTFYDGAMHLCAVKIQPAASSSEIIAVSMDGANWDVTPNNTLGTSYTINRYGAGCRPAQSPSAIFNGSLLAMWAYENGTYASWDNTWISDLYANPWQFLTTASSKLMLLGVG